MLPLILGHLPSHRSIHAAPFTITNPITQSLIYATPTSTLKHSHWIGHSLNHSIYHSIKWLIDRSFMHASKHTHTYRHRVTNWITNSHHSLKLTLTRSLIQKLNQSRTNSFNHIFILTLIQCMYEQSGDDVTHSHGLGSSMHKQKYVQAKGYKFWHFQQSPYFEIDSKCHYRICLRHYRLMFFDLFNDLTTCMCWNIALKCQMCHTSNLMMTLR